MFIYRNTKIRVLEQETAGIIIPPHFNSAIRIKDLVQHDPRALKGKMKHNHQLFES
jgi:hypothetical protein